MLSETKYQITLDEKIDAARAKLIHNLRDLENNIYMSYDFFNSESQGSTNNTKYHYAILKNVHQLGLGEYNQFMSGFIEHYYAGKTTNTEYDWYSRDHDDIYGDINDNLVFQYSQYKCEEMNSSLVANYYVREPLQKLIALTAEDDFFSPLHQQYLKFEAEVVSNGF